MTDSPEQEQPVTKSGTCALGTDLTINRLGFGAMRITGPGIWGPPADEGAAVAVLRRAVELGVNFIDTADSYGPAVSEQLIRRALHPYNDVVIATKAGLTRTGPDQWHALGFPTYLKQQCELSLRRLGVEEIDLFQLHRVDERVPLADQVGALRELQEAGKVRHIGLSEVTIAQVQAAQDIAAIVTVQNKYNVLARASEPLLRHCEAEGIGFIPWYPIATGALTGSGGGSGAGSGGELGTLAASTGHTPAQLALAWLLGHSPVLLPIPGTQSLAHVQENCASALINLSDVDMGRLSALSSPGQDPHRTATS